jgi:hypothetical protein
MNTGATIPPKAQSKAHCCLSGMQETPRWFLSQREALSVPRSGLHN